MEKAGGYGKSMQYVLLLYTSAVHLFSYTGSSMENKLKYPNNTAIANDENKLFW